MEYQVPQFIEVEDKIIGPLTLRQFIYLSGTSGICIIFFSYLPLIFAILLSLPVAGFGAALAFYKINGKPFIEIVEAGFNYYTGKKLLLWKYTELTKTEGQAAAKAAAIADAAARPVRGAPKLTRGKLSELAWSLDVKPSGTVTTRADS
ncbi:MAG: PrgI family protein [Candidatus Paceibacterota bacterium]|jgi:hypothetical protein